MPEVIPQVGKCLIYDDDDDDIKANAAVIGNILRVYAKPSDAITMCKISDWKYSQNEASTFLFFVSIETEDFHIRIKKLVTPESENVLVLLKYTIATEQYVDRIIKGMKKAAKGKIKEKQKENMHQVEKKIIKVLDLKDSSVWWPSALQFLCGRTRTSRKEIGVSLLVDERDEKQMHWFSRQRQVLEENLSVRCLKIDPKQVEKYVMNSDCVVVYLCSKDLANGYQLMKKHPSEKCKLLTDLQADVLEKAEKHKCKTRVLVNKIVAKFDRKLVKHTGSKLKMVGEGELEYWAGLLRDLGIVKFHPCPDPTFYSGVPDKSCRTRYTPPETRPPTTRHGVVGDIDGPMEIDLRPVHGDSLREQTLYSVCYTYGAGNHDNDGDVTDHLILHSNRRIIPVCCNPFHFFR